MILPMGQILDQIREAIQASGKSRYRISKDTEITQSQLSRLLSGKRGLSIEALENMAEYLGFEVTLKPKQKRKGK